MKTSTTYILIALFALVIAGMFGFAAYQKKQMANEPAPTETETDQYAGITRVDAKHFYQNGLHTIVGEIPLPTPCDILGATGAAGLEDGKPVIDIDFTVTNNAEMCAQVVTPQKFMVSVEAGPNPDFHAHFNERDIELNIIPAAPGETPESFELFLKG